MPRSRDFTDDLEQLLRTVEDTISYHLKYPIRVFVIAHMGPAHSKTYSINSKRNPEGKAQMEETVAALQNRILELEQAAQAISAEKADYEQRLASMSGMIDKLVLEKAEEKAEYEQRLAAMTETIDERVLERTEEEAQMEQKVAALQNRTLELEEAAQAISAEKAEYEQRLAAMTETIEKRVLERTEKQAAEYDLKLAAVLETIDERVLERTQEKADYEQKLASMSGMIDKLVLEKAEEKAEYEQRLAAMTEAIEKRVLERTEKQTAEYDLKLAAVLETIDERVLERTEKQTAEYDLKLAAVLETIDERVLERTEKQTAEYDLKLAAVLETIDEQVLERTEKQTAEYDLKLAAVLETIDEQVLERTEKQTAEYDLKLAAVLETIDEQILERTEKQTAEYDLKLAAVLEMIDEQVLERTEKQTAEYDLKLAAVLETIDERVLERTEIQKAESEQKLAALSQRIDELVPEKAEMQRNARMDRSLVDLERITIKLEQSSQERKRAAVTEEIEKQVLERTEIQKAECEVKLAAMSQRIHELVQKKTDEKAQMEQKVAALQNRTLELEEAAQAISAEKADYEEKLASMSGMIDKLVLEKEEEKAEYEHRLAAVSETIDRQVQERTEEQKADFEQKLAALTEGIALLCLEKMEMRTEAMIELNAGVMAEPIDLPIQATVEREAQMDHDMPAGEETYQARTLMDLREHTVEKRTTVLVQAAKAISKESGEFRDESAAEPDTIDLRLLTTTQEKMTAASTEPINMAPTAPGSHDPSGVQSNGSEQFQRQQPNQGEALTEEGAHELLCSSNDWLMESLRSQGQDIHNRSLEIASRGLYAEQEKQTAALGCSSVSQLQEEERLLPPEQSPSPEPPAEEEKMQTDHSQNESETSDELSLDPEPCVGPETIFKLLYSNDRLMNMEGLDLIHELAKHQPDALFPDRREISRAVLRMVLNPLDSVSEAALETLAHLLSLLETFFDPFLGWITDVLFLKTISCNETIRRLANEALDQMIRSCSPVLCMKELLFVLRNPGMEDPDLEAIAREGFAIHLLGLVKSAYYDPEMDELIPLVSELTQDTSEVVRSCGEKMLAILLTLLEGSQESVEFRDESAATPDTIDLRLLTTTQEMTAASTDPINMAPTAPGSRDPSGVQLNGSEQFQCQQPNQDEALTEEGAHELPCSSRVSVVESGRSQQYIDNSQEMASSDLYREQEKQTAALGCSSVSELQEEERLLPPEQSPSPEPPAEEEEMQTDHSQNESETDELSLDPEPCVGPEIFKLLYSNDRLMNMMGLDLVHELAKHQPDALFPDRREISRAVLRMVLNPLDSVSEAALETLAHLLSLLETFFDPFLGWISDVLFLKTTSNNETIRQLANEALDQMIRSCSPVLCMKELLFVLRNPGMEDPELEAIAREGFAIHLLVLVKSAHYDPEMDELIPLVSELTQDTSEVVRSCGEKMLAILSTLLEGSQIKLKLGKRVTVVG